MFNKIKAKAREFGNNVKEKFVSKETQAKAMAHAALEGTVAEAYIDTAVKILIAVVIGALLLGVLYAVFDDNIRDSLTNWVTNLFSKGDDLVSDIGG